MSREDDLIEAEDNMEEEEVEEMSEKNDVGKVLVAFFLGGVAGALAGLLLAPASGAETRKKIKETSLEAKAKALEKIESAKGEAAELVTRGKGKIGDVKSQIQAAMEAGKEAYKQKREELIQESEEEK